MWYRSSFVGLPVAYMAPISVRFKHTLPRNVSYVRPPLERTPTIFTNPLSLSPADCQTLSRTRDVAEPGNEPFLAYTAPARHQSARSSRMNDRRREFGPLVNDRQQSTQTFPISVLFADPARCFITPTGQRIAALDPASAPLSTLGPEMIATRKASQLMVPTGSVALPVFTHPPPTCVTSAPDRVAVGRPMLDRLTRPVCCNPWGERGGAQRHVFATGSAWGELPRSNRTAAWGAIFAPTTTSKCVSAL